MPCLTLVTTTNVGGGDVGDDDDVGDDVGMMGVDGARMLVRWKNELFMTIPIHLLLGTHRPTCPGSHQCLLCQVHLSLP